MNAGPALSGFGRSGVRGSWFVPRWPVLRGREPAAPAAGWLLALGRGFFSFFRGEPASARRVTLKYVGLNIFS